MNAQRCTLVFQYQDSSGDVHCVADCTPCYTVYHADNIAGPWVFDREGVAGQDIPIEPLRYYKVEPRECETGELDDAVVAPPPA